MNPNNELLTGYGDAAALMLAAVDDRPALDAMLKSLTFGEAAKLLISAIEVGASLVSVGDRSAEPIRARKILADLIEATRLDDDGNVG
jgi:hypothetical protein